VQPSSWGHHAQAQAIEQTEQAPQRSESPYFFIKSEDPAVAPLLLKFTWVDVRIAEVIVGVTVMQQYKNEGSRAIKARYVFPVSANAAVHAMHVRLGVRLIAARIQEK
jgi:Ca-activated chloride channel homolog